jgi:hypothetical protein
MLMIGGPADLQDCALTANKVMFPYYANSFAGVGQYLYERKIIEGLDGKHIECYVFWPMGDEEASSLLADHQRQLVKYLPAGSASF